jgi:cytochrome P450
MRLNVTTVLFSLTAQTFILAGYETTSVALTYTVFALASYPEIEKKLLAEVDAFW